MQQETSNRNQEPRTKNQDEGILCVSCSQYLLTVKGQSHRTRNKQPEIINLSIQDLVSSLLVFPSSEAEDSLSKLLLNLRFRGCLKQKIPLEFKS